MGMNGVWEISAKNKWVTCFTDNLVLSITTTTTFATTTTNFILTMRITNLTKYLYHYEENSTHLKCLKLE